MIKKILRKPKMMSRPLISILALTFLFFLNAFISADPQDISEYQKRLDEIKAQINHLRAKINEEERRESNILSRIDTISFKKSLIRKEITLASLELNRLNQELSSVKRRIPQLNAKLEEENKSIERTLITLYKFGKLSTFQFMLQTEDISTFISQNKHLTLLAQHQEKIFSNYLDLLNQLKLAEEEIEEKKKEQINLVNIAKAKKRELDTQERKHKALIMETKQNKKMHLQTLEELKEREQQLQLLIEKLIKEKISFPILIIPLYEMKGKLPWPIEGQVVTFYGKEVHPQFKTTTMNNGIEISPPKNTMVAKTIHPGKIVYCDHLQGYGNLIIIDHGMNYHSLYGHCSDFLVKKGDLVKTGQPIALVGDTGSLKGLTLYFEIREKTKPRDPLQWLKRR